MKSNYIPQLPDLSCRIHNTGMCKCRCALYTFVSPFTGFQVLEFSETSQESSIHASFVRSALDSIDLALCACTEVWRLLRISADLHSLVVKSSEQIPSQCKMLHQRL